MLHAIKNCNHVKVEMLVKDFARQVDENKSILQENEELEWSRVVLEVKEFLDVKNIIILGFMFFLNNEILTLLFNTCFC